MNTITADTTLPQSLVTVTGLTAVVDAAGKLLGYYAPVCNAEAAAYAQAAARIDPAESKRRLETADKWHTTAEVLEHLKNLER